MFGMGGTHVLRTSCVALLESLQIVNAASQSFNTSVPLEWKRKLIVV